MIMRCKNSVFRPEDVYLRGKSLEILKKLEENLCVAVKCLTGLFKAAVLD